MSSDTRATLLERLRDGADPLAWDEFFRLYWPVIYAASRHHGCSEATAEDIVQDVMLTVFGQRDIFRYDPERGCYRDWLRTVVRNKVIEYRRRPSERPALLGEPAAGRAGEVEAQDPPPDETWERAFEGSLLLALLDIIRREVNPRDYLAFELLELRELSGRDAARTSGMTRNAAYKARRRVFRRLKKLAGTYEEDGRLHERVKEAVKLRLPPSVERSLTARMEDTLRSRSEALGHGR